MCPVHTGTYYYLVIDEEPDIMEALPTCRPDRRFVDAFGVV